MLKESIDNNRAWAIKEIRDGSDWWMIRGGAFSNKTNNKYPKRLFKEKGDAELFSNNLNREGNWKTKIVEVWNFKKDKDNKQSRGNRLQVNGIRDGFNALNERGS